MEGVLRTRTLTAMVLGPLFVVSILAGPWPFAVLLGGAVLVAARELGRLLRDIGWCAPINALPVMAGLVFGSALYAVPWGWSLGAATLLTWLLLLFWLVHPVAPKRPLGGPLAWVVFVIGALYLGLLPSYLLRMQPGPWDAAGTAESGRLWVLFSVLLVWASDSGAYLVGRSWGRRKLWPDVSPSKTREGAAGSIVFCVAASLALSRLWAPALSVAEALAYGLGVSVFAQLGDLVQSRIKRCAGAKDSGTLFPGHGGVFDRFDSLFFAAPLFCYYLRAFAR